MYHSQTTTPLGTAMPGATSTSQPEAKKMPCGHTMGGRNLIVCIDGTSNQFGDKNTNVIELYNLILKEIEDKQKTWYNSGIGTYAQPSWKSPKYYKKVLSHKIDLAIAWNFEKTLLGGYEWLSEHYEPGDRIFLFGFSRGAFQVRTLSAMIDKVGLIHPGNKMQIPFAYELYADAATDLPAVTTVGSSQPAGERPNVSKAERFKRAFSRKDVKVHFVGAWDTVSSIGLARGTKMLPRTVDGMKHVCFFRHALALDERRVKFLPEFAHGGTTLSNSESQKDTPTNGITSPTASPPFADGSAVAVEQTREAQKSKKASSGMPPHTKEVWFAGTHSDIGGGNVQNEGMDRSRPPLRWMVFEAGAVGLRTARFERDLSGSEQISVIESLKGIWWLLEFLPFKHLTFTGRQEGKVTTRKPHFGTSRRIQAGQKIHTSLLLAKGKHAHGYTPRARPPPDVGVDEFWNELRRDGSINNDALRERLEFDLYEYTKAMVGTLITDADEPTMRGLRHIAVSADGQQAVYDAVIEGLKSAHTALMRESKFAEVGHEPQTEILKEATHNKQSRLLQAALQILGTRPDGGTQLELRKSSEVFSWISDLWDDEKEEYREEVRGFILQLTNPCLHVLEQHEWSVLSVAFSLDGKRIVSGSGDRKIFIWDAATGTILKGPLEGHTKSAPPIAFSPDGKHVVSGSADKKIRVWDAETGKTVVEPFKGHTDWVNSVAFSPDGSRVVSGSDDRTVRIWEAETGKPVGEPLRGHTSVVLSVAFSPDGKHVVSGSSDCTVLIWDVETGNAVGEPLEGHTDDVNSVAFSPVGSRIVSGSDDETIQIWDATTGEMVVGPIQGHTGSVYSVAFSPDGRYVVSGSYDETVRIWDAETGKQVGEPLREHTGRVESVAFSPDGKRVASGSRGGTIRIWDVETWVKVARLDSIYTPAAPPV